MRDVLASTTPSDWALWMMGLAIICQALATLRVWRWVRPRSASITIEMRVPERSFGLTPRPDDLSALTCAVRGTRRPPTAMLVAIGLSLVALVAVLSGFDRIAQASGLSSIGLIVVLLIRQMRG